MTEPTAGNVPPVSDPAAARRDRHRLTALVLLFGIALGVTGFAFPLLALESGISPAIIGLLAATSAALQMASRLALPWLLARYPDRDLMAWSMGSLGFSALVVFISREPAAFVVAQAAQGMARGVFHTASQTHAVRDAGPGTRRLAYVQTAAQFGHLIGPGVAGVIALLSLRAALWLTIGVGALGAVGGYALARKPPYPRLDRAKSRPVWRRQDLGTACWGGSLGGAWRALSESFIAVILVDRGVSTSSIGLLLSTADGAGFLTTASVARWGPADVRRFVPVAAVALASAVAVLPIVSGMVPVVALLIVAGSAGGVAGVLGTAVAHRSVSAAEQGAAITLVGTYRAATRLVVPAGISSALAVVALPVAVSLAAAAMVVPGLWLVRVDRRLGRAGAGSA